MIGDTASIDALSGDTILSSCLLSRAICDADLHSSTSAAAAEAEFHGGSHDVPDHTRRNSPPMAPFPTRRRLRRSARSR